MTEAAALELAPMTVLSIDPPDIVKSLATYASAIAVPVHSPDVTVPVVVMELMFPVVRKVPFTFGKVNVLSAVGSVTDNVVSKSSELLPSNTKGDAPVKVPTVVALTSDQERVPLPFVDKT